MSHLNIIRAWKDEEYRLSLTEAQRALLPLSPVGLVDLTEADLKAIAGGLAGTTWTENGLQRPI
jgi:mersacidin/lichenicidin family type 2 lantibiotic